MTLTNRIGSALLVFFLILLQEKCFSFNSVLTQEHQRWDYKVAFYRLCLFLTVTNAVWHPFQIDLRKVSGRKTEREKISHNPICHACVNSSPQTFCCSFYWDCFFLCSNKFALFFSYILKQNERKAVMTNQDRVIIPEELLNFRKSSAFCSWVDFNPIKTSYFPLW